MTSGTAKGVSIPYPRALQKLALKNLDVRSVKNYGIEGMTSTQIASKFGAKPPLLTLTEGLIPAEGDANINSTEFSNLSSKSNYGKLKYTGTLAGIQGTLSVSWNPTEPEKAGVTAFKRDSPGKVLPVGNAIPFIIDQEKWKRNVIVIWSGRNDILSQFSNETIIANIDFMVKSIGANEKFVVLGVTDASFEPPDSQGYQQILSLNKNLSDKYSGHWIDIRNVLVKSYNSSLSLDVEAFNTGKIAPSLLIDGLHLNDSCNKIVSEAVYDFIKGKNW